MYILSNVCEIPTCGGQCKGSRYKALYVPQDWSYVFKPPTIYKYVGSSKYEPLATLPSQMLPPVVLPPHAVYRPSWQRKHEPAAPHRTATPAIDGNTLCWLSLLKHLALTSN